MELLRGWWYSGQGETQRGAGAGGREDESQRERERRGKTWSRRTGSVATGGGPWGERAWRGGGSRPGDDNISEINKSRKMY